MRVVPGKLRIGTEGDVAVQVEDPVPRGRVAEGLASCRSRGTSTGRPVRLVDGLKASAQVVALAAALGDADLDAVEPVRHVAPFAGGGPGDDQTGRQLVLLRQDPVQSNDSSCSSSLPTAP